MLWHIWGEVAEHLYEQSRVTLVLNLPCVVFFFFEGFVYSTHFP